MAKKVYGVGINDIAKASQSVYYKRWASMLQRCYSRGTQEIQPTYEGCYVSYYWHKLSNFKAWMETQDWVGKQLDKDLLGDGYLYSPENCCFISPQLNSLIEPRGYEVDLSNEKVSKVSYYLNRESDERVIRAVKSRYRL